VIYLGLGSNLNDPIAQLKQATDAIAAIPGVTLRKSSPNYRNPPLDNTNQPDYVNKVLAIASRLSPEDLLTKLQVIEIQQGRPREHGHWTPRTIDIDILLYDDVIMDTPHLTLPHPGLTSRAFVVLPLLAIAPNLCLPNGQYLLDYRHQFPEDSLDELH
jgi:2-amino-4-hydroxy-6-hydroxymethyldihydropteridine diphosphokinase